MAYFCNSYNITKLIHFLIFFKMLKTNHHLKIVFILPLILISFFALFVFLEYVLDINHLNKILGKEFKHESLHTYSSYQTTNNSYQIDFQNPEKSDLNNLHVEGQKSNQNQSNIQNAFNISINYPGKIVDEPNYYSGNTLINLNDESYPTSKSKYNKSDFSSYNLIAFNSKEINNISKRLLNMNLAEATITNSDMNQVLTENSLAKLPVLPNDPGVPIGNGLYFLVFLSIIYTAFKLRKKMKINNLFKISFLILVFSTSKVFADGTYTIGTNGNYPTLSSAATAVNNGDIQGSLVLKIINDITETDSVIFKASGTASASYTDIQIKPEGSIKITSSYNGYAIILDGADNITINGLSENGDSLTILSSATNANAGVLKIFNDASNNTITKCNLLGSSPISTTGIVNIGSGISTGNRSNTFNYCNIGPATGCMVPVGIYSLGLSAEIYNSATITHCNLQDLTSTSVANNHGLFLGDNNRNWNISNNSFFFKNQSTFTTETYLNLIKMDSGQGSNISGNYFGGSAPACGGTPADLNGKIASFVSIFGTNRILGLDSVDLVHIYNNKTQNIQIISTTTVNSNALNPRFSGLVLNTGRFEITNNLIGSSTNVDNIQIQNNITLDFYVVGFSLGNSTNTGNNLFIQKLNHNQISGIKTSSTTAKRCNFRGIDIYQKTNQIKEIKGNTIGSDTLLNSIFISSGSAAIYGIYAIINSMTEKILFTNNKIKNFKIIQPASSGTFRAISISQSLITNGILIDSCEISNIDARTNSVGSLNFYGIQLSEYNYNKTKINALLAEKIISLGLVYGVIIDGVISISNSIVRDLEGSRMNGINIYAYTGSNNTTKTEIVNNLILLGKNSTIDLYITGIEFYLDEFASSSSYMNFDFQHNTVFITGNSPTNNRNTYAFYCNSYFYGSNYIKINTKNNIFFNNRASTGVSNGRHYGIYANYDQNTNSIFKNNLFFAPSGYSAYVNGTSYNTLPVSATNHLNSVMADPLFENSNGNATIDFTPNTELLGDTSSYTKDLLGETRDDYFTIGALQQSGISYWTATEDNNFTSDSNWTDAKVASNNSNLIIDQTATKNIFLNQSKKLKKIDFNTNSNGVKLELKDSVLSVGSILNANADNYIRLIGKAKLKLKVSNGSTTIFPVGTSNYSPVKITNNSGADDEFSVNVLDSVTSNGSRTGNLLNNYRIKKTIEISRTNNNNGNGIDIQLDWNNEDAAGVSQPQFFEFDNTLSSWKKSLTTSVTGNTAKITGYTGNATKFYVGQIEDIVWNGTNFVHNTLSAPDYYTNLTLNGDDFSANNLKVNDLTIKTGKKITNLTGSNSLVMGDLTLQSNDQGTSQFLNNANVTVGGSTILEKTFEGGKWYFVSFPFDIPANNIFKISDNVESVATWGDPIGNSYVSGKDIYVAEYDAFNRDRETNGSPAFNASGNYWTNLNTKTMIAGKGYIVALDGNGPLTFRFKSSIGANTVTSTDVTTNVNKYSTSAYPVNHSWNLIGNPYLSGFDLQNANYHKPYYLFDGTTYKVIMGDISDEDSERQMLPFYSFFCQATDENSTIDFTSAGKMMKSPSYVSLPNYDIIKLIITDANNQSLQDAARIRIGEGFTNSFKLGEDAVKMNNLNPEVPQILTSSDGVDLSVNSISTEVNQLKIKTYFPKPGRYKISLKNQDYATGLSSLILKDNVTLKSYNLFETNEIEIEAVKGTSDRFTIYFTQDNITKEVSNEDNKIRILKSELNWKVEGLQNTSKVEIYDISGKIVWKSNHFSASDMIPALQPGIYVLRILNLDGNLIYYSKI